jgi:hypothetical protein
MPLYDSATLYDSAVVTYDGRNTWDTSPSISIYLAFDGTPYEVAPVWTDVTGYVSQVDTDRSRSDDFSAFVSTATVVFRNETQLFSPFNTAGTYYGKLKPRLQIKIEATVLGNIYPVFRGFCAGFPVSQTQAGYESTVTVQCFDALALLATELVTDYVYDFTKTLSPLHYWRCNDGQSSTTITDDVAGLTMSPSGTTFYRTGSQVSQALASPSISTGDTSYITATTTNTATVGDCTLSAWLVPQYAGTVGSIAISVLGGFPTFRIGIISGSIRALVDGVNQSFRTSTNANYAINDPPIFVSATYVNATRVVELYINGVAQTGATSTLETTLLTPIGFGTINRSMCQEFTVIASAITAAQALALYNINNNNVSETTAVRFARYIAMTSFSSSLTTVTTTPVATVGALPPPNTSLIQAIQRTVDSEGGFMYVDKAGFICFRDRNYVYTNTTCNTSQATFSTAGIRFEPEVQMELTGDNIRNDITVTFSGGGTTNKTNATSIAAYGTNAMSLDTHLSTIAQAKTLGTYTATVAGNLTSDLSPVRVNTTGSEANWATLLGLEVLDRTTITIAPQTGSSFTKVQLLNSIQHHITPSEWEMTIDGSSQYTAFFILDKSSLDGTDLLQ